MNGAHDLGGISATARKIEKDEPIFHDEWEKRVFQPQWFLLEH